MIHLFYLSIDFMLLHLRLSAFHFSFLILFFYFFIIFLFFIVLFFNYFSALLFLFFRCFSVCRQNLGGRLKVMVSGGSALPLHIESFFDMAGLRVSAGYLIF